MEKNRDFDIGWGSNVIKKMFRTMKVFICILVLSLSSVTASTFSQVRVSIDVKNATLKEVFKEITKLTGYEFVYSNNEIERIGKVSLNVSNKDLKDVLAECLKGTQLWYMIEEQVVVISPKLLQAESKDVNKATIASGRVVGEDKKPIPGVTVLLKGTSTGVTTGVDGVFFIMVPDTTANVEFIFSFVGMKKKVVTVKDRKPLNVVMEEEVTSMDEVVVTGIFNKPKESFTGAAVKVTREELKAAGNRNILKSLSNIDPSFQIVENNAFGSDPNKLPEIRLRGVSTIPSVSDLQTDMRAELCTPLFILDGFEITLERVMDLNNDEIESITILKDASATAIYGSRGANGVVVIKSVQPEQGKLKISYNGNLNLEIPSLSSYNLMDAAGKLQLEWDAGLYENKFQ